VLPIAPTEPLRVTPGSRTVEARLDAAPTAMDRLAADSRPRRQRGLFAAWIASVALLLLMLGAGAIWRDVLTRTWPASERLYAWVGLPSGPAPQRE
jgi:hypothetical protein